MAITLLPQQQGFLSGLGSGLGQGFGTNFTSGLQSLVDLKMQELAQKRQEDQQKQQLQDQAKALAGSGLGLSEDQATQILQQSPSVQKQLLSAYLQGPANQALLSTLGIGGQQAQPGFPVAPTAGGYASPLDQIRALEGPQGLRKTLGEQPQVSGLEALNQFQVGSLSPNTILQLGQAQQRERGLALKQEQNELARQDRLAREQAAALEKNQAHAFKVNKPYIEKSLKEADRAQEEIPVLRQLIGLNDSGKVQSSWTGWGESPETKQFKALSSEYIGGMAPNSAMAKQMQPILDPSLSKEARDATLRRRLKSAEDRILNRTVVEGIISENGGFTPLDLRDQVSNRKKSILQQLEENPELLQQLQQPPEEAPTETPVRPAARTEEAETIPQAVSRVAGAVGEDIKSLPRTLGHLGARGLEAAYGGLTNVIAAPFEAAHAIAGTPVPKAIKTLEALPKDIAEFYFGKELATPKTETERVTGEFVNDVISFVMPGSALKVAGKAVKAGSKAAKWIDAAAKFLNISPKEAAAVSGIGNAAEWTARKLGASEREAGITKIGAMLSVPILGARLPGQLNKITQGIEEAIPATATFKHPVQFATQADEIYTALSRGTQNKLKTALKSDIENVISGKKVSDLWDLKKSLSNPKLPAALTESGVEALPAFEKYVDAVLGQATKEIPVASNLISEFSDLNNALKTSNFVFNTAKEHLSFRPKYALTNILLSAFSATQPAKSALLAGGALGIGEASRVLAMMAKSPSFRKYYQGYLNASLSGSIKQMNDYAKKLDATIGHELQKDIRAR